MSLLFRLQGAAGATSGALGQVLRTALTPDLDATTPVVLPAVGGWSPPGTIEGGRLTVAGLALGVDGGGGVDGGRGTSPVEQSTVVVVARADDKDVAVTVPTAQLSLRPVTGLDPRLRLAEVNGEVDTAKIATADRASLEQVSTWAGAVAMARVALGHELVGASRTMLELARTHALERIQFGRPISSFQAIRHRLAETLVAVETADAVLSAAWDDRSPQTAAMAKAMAGRGARTAARHCQQVLAGIGFTTEHPLHLHVRRVLVLDELFGPARALTGALGADVLATRRLPALLPL